MSANVLGEKVYSYRESMWHRLGIVSDVPLGAEEAGKKIGLYEVSKRPFKIELNGEMTPSGDYALVRSAVPEDNQERIFGYVTDGYNVLQPIEVCRLFDENVKTNIETMGVLANGKKLFVTWTLPSFDIGGDEIKCFGFIAIGYNGKYGASLYLTLVRVVCENTWNAAVGGAEKGGKGSKIWTGRHNSKDLGKDLGIWLSHVQTQAKNQQADVQGRFLMMDKYEFTDDGEVEDALELVYPDPIPIPANWPSKLKQKKEEAYETALEKAIKDRENVMMLWDGEGTAIKATAWGLFNCVTEFENWYRPTRRPAEYSIMLGGRGQTMTKAYDGINQYMKLNS